MASRSPGSLAAVALAAAGFAAAAVFPALAQGTAQPTPANPQVAPPVMPGDPRATVPERIEPPSSGSPGSAAGGSGGGTGAGAPPAPPGTLSDKLSRQRGVLQPPAGIDPEIRVRPPEPGSGTMPVIPPPGEPGNPSPVVPK